MRACKIYDEATIPTKAHPGDAGWDLYAAYSKTIEPGAVVAIGTGLAVAIPDGFVGVIVERSSVGMAGVAIRGGIIDSGFRGEVRVLIQNLSKVDVHILKGNRVAQMIVIPIASHELVVVDRLPPSVRDVRGFGSTGK